MRIFRSVACKCSFKVRAALSICVAGGAMMFGKNLRDHWFVFFVLLLIVLLTIAVASPTSSRARNTTIELQAAIIKSVAKKKVSSALICELKDVA